MKNIFNLIALVLGIGQSTAQSHVLHYYHTYTPNCTFNGQKIDPKTPIMNICLKDISKREFVNHMKSKNIICL